jgi:hypothetical protein
LLFLSLFKDRQSRRGRPQALVFVRYFFNRWIRITCKLSNINQKVKENIPFYFLTQGERGLLKNFKKTPQLRVKKMDTPHSRGMTREGIMPVC